MVIEISLLAFLFSFMDIRPSENWNCVHARYHFEPEILDWAKISDTHFLTNRLDLELRFYFLDICVSESRRRSAIAWLLAYLASCRVFPPFSRIPLSQVTNSSNLSFQFLQKRDKVNVVLPANSSVRNFTANPYHGKTTHRLPPHSSLPVRHGRAPHKHRRPIYRLPQHPPLNLLFRTHGLDHKTPTPRPPRQRSHPSPPRILQSATSRSR